MNNNKIKISIISILIILNFIYFPFENNNKNIKYYNYFNYPKNNINIEKPLEIVLIPESFNSMSINFSCSAIDSDKLEIKNEETIIIFVEYLKQISKLKKSNQLIIPINEKSNNGSKHHKHQKPYDWLISQIINNKHIFNIKNIIYIQSIDGKSKNKT
ncbi:hypothetical protein ACTA71_009849 [Dictyostelium dimigraforme]